MTCQWTWFSLFDETLNLKKTKKNISFSFHVFFAFYAIYNTFRKQQFSGGGGGVQKCLWC